MADQTQELRGLVKALRMFANAQSLAADHPDGSDYTSGKYNGKADAYENAALWIEEIIGADCTVLGEQACGTSACICGKG